MGDGSTDDEDALAKPPGNFVPDPGSNEFVKVTGPEEHVDEMEKQPDDISFTPAVSSAPELENGEKDETETTSPKPGLFSGEAALHAEPESSKEVGDGNNTPHVPGSFNLIDPLSSQGERDEGHSTWAEIFKRLRLK
jgi:hypothetical protein